MMFLLRPGDYIWSVLSAGPSHHKMINACLCVSVHAQAYEREEWGWGRKFTGLGRRCFPERINKSENACCHHHIFLFSEMRANTQHFFVSGLYVGWNALKWGAVVQGRVMKSSAHNIPGSFLKAVFTSYLNMVYLIGFDNMQNKSFHCPSIHVTIIDRNLN